MERVYNFNAGPSALPEEILKIAKEEMLSYKGSGMSVMELSHRGGLYEELHNETIKDIRTLYRIPDNFDVLFLQGGASSQFFMVPMNFLNEKNTADYVITGAWSEKAYQEIEIMEKNAKIICDMKDTNYSKVPEKINVRKESLYVYLTSNETIHGVQFKRFPDTDGVPLVIDASSDIFSYYIDWNRVMILFAGAQKNAGPAGITIVIIRKDLYEKENKKLPTMLRYSTHAKNNSLYNTPPTFVIYMVGLYMKYLLNKGGITEIEKINNEKAKLIYDVIDNSNNFYIGHADKSSRSNMNITFNLAKKELEKEFLQLSEKNNLFGLKGHRSVGGFRASIYNAVSLEACKALADFMKDFANKKG